jgi:hypothetical protein
VDAALLVCDARSTTKPQREAIGKEVAAVAGTCLAAVENFVPGPPESVH